MNDEMLLFVEEQAAKLTHEDIVALASRLPALRERILSIAVLEYPQLAAQYEFLALKVEDCSQLLESHLSDVCDRELAFALLYLEAKGDILPDAIPGIGMTDDQALVETVLYKHREALRRSPRGYMFAWATEPVDFNRMILDRLHHRLVRARTIGFWGMNGSKADAALHVTH